MTVTVKGLDHAIKTLDKLNANLFKPMTKAAAHIHNKMADYPPQGANVTGYVRTGTLGRQWEHRVEDDGRRGIAENKQTPYAGYVQSAVQQAWMHRGRWSTDAEIAEQEADTVAGFFREEIRKYT